MSKVNLIWAKNPQKSVLNCLQVNGLSEAILIILNLWKKISYSVHTVNLKTVIILKREFRGHGLKF